jgi:hypothetical protein
MNKIMLICSLALFISGYVMANEPSGDADSVQAIAEAKGNVDTEAVAVTDALPDLTLAATGGDDSTTNNLVPR